MTITNKSKRIKEERKRLFHEFSEGVTVHGFRFMFDQHHWCRRLLWVAINTTIFCFSFVLFYGIVLDFIASKTVTTVEKGLLQLHEIEFPTVTVCPAVVFLKVQNEKDISAV